ncbi:MAG: NifB/NifX family molybdenum-iron cluster-binding protein [Alphaproteobacteria bacterium]|nr:NifB/NifX family molybdenum-iron cluster-binding protein [Alphaproteobacteria bacterium]
MKIAVTSQNYRTVTNHAGKCRKYIIYEIDEANHANEIERLNLPQDLAFTNFRGESHPLDQVNVLLSLSFGREFLRKMKDRGITASIAKSDVIIEAIESYLKNGQTLPVFDCDTADESSCSCH